MTNEKPLENLVGGYSNTAIFRTMAVIGDSLSSGEFETLDKDGNHGWYDMYQYSWGQFLARRNGLTLYNFSEGGMTAKDYVERFAEEKGFWDKDKACQAYVIALGVNDIHYQDMKIGNAEDITAKAFPGERPFISYYAEIVRRYQEISPDAKFFFVTFPNDDLIEDKTKIEDMINALYTLAEHFENAYVINLFAYGPVYDDAFRETYFLHGHMNPIGYLFTANLIDSYIDYIIRTNPADFKNVGFIGTNIKYQ
ncbi:MAG: SGNH/GDSL hydrolase family protein [Oscillospiraceae bacterium]|nr:SGNH/GDSL hydrolase family protein [Oscillospiraceae bacterium]